MKKLFYLSLLLLLVYEALNVYFIMPMPGSQRMNSISAAYFLFHWRWIFRALFCVLMVYAFLKASWKRKWLVAIPALVIGVVIYFVNFKMSADHMFYQPKGLVFAGAAKNKTDTNRLVIGVVMNNEAKAYPIQFIGFHHIVPDTIGGRPVLITYCTVCRSGRAFDPVVDGKGETFRLVGMDHFNAMVEDATTKSWWRQATGEAVAGEKKGKKLKEIFCTQTSLGEWLRLHPASLVMQEDEAYKQYYAKTFDYETGKSRSMLTGTDTLSWKDKSWVIGVEREAYTKAYDWSMLKGKHIIEDNSDQHRTVIVLSKDNRSFFAFDMSGDTSVITFYEDMIALNGHRYMIDGTGIDTSYSLKKLPAYQEFWHSWRTFHPETKVYN